MVGKQEKEKGDILFQYGVAFMKLLNKALTPCTLIYYYLITKGKTLHSHYYPDWMIWWHRNKERNKVRKCQNMWRRILILFLKNENKTTHFDEWRWTTWRGAVDTSWWALAWVRGFVFFEVVQPFNTMMVRTVLVVATRAYLLKPPSLYWWPAFQNPSIFLMQRINTRNQ